MLIPSSLVKALFKEEVLKKIRQEVNRGKEVKVGIEDIFKALKNNYKYHKLGKYDVLLRGCLPIRQDSPNIYKPDEQVTIYDFIFGAYPNIGIPEEDVEERKKRIESENKAKKIFEFSRK